MKNEVEEDETKDQKEKTMEMGDVKAMREALERIRTYAQSKGRRVMNATWIYNVCDAALSAPVRNCDLGSVEEQLERHRLYCIGLCTAHECDYALEKHDTETCKKCFAKWAQMKRVG